MTTAHHIDDPAYYDNRRYDYSEHPVTERSEYPIIVDWVKPKSRVLDLACGNGSLLLRLQKEKEAEGTGIEISESGVAVCRSKGLNVISGRIDERLPFADDAFEYAVCNVTLQMVMYPEVVLREMKRVARYQIVTFPNFAFWKNRLDLLLKGRMPNRILFGYSWYATGHIHQLSLRDFEQLVGDIGGLTIIGRKLDENTNSVKKVLMRMFPNLFQLLGFYLLEKK